MAAPALNGVNVDDTTEPSVATATESNSCNGSAHPSNRSSQQQKPASVQKRHHSSSQWSDHTGACGEDESKKPLLPKSSSSSRPQQAASEKKREPVVLKDMDELRQHLELMHDRCIARNLRAAGLGGFETEDEVIYGVLDANAHMTTGETMLIATILYLKEPDRLHHYVSILLNDGADVNEQDQAGKTALMQAVVNGRDKAARAIMRHDKTDLLTLDKDGNTALMHAAAVGSENLTLYYFKILRKREKQQFRRQQHSRADDDQKTSNIPSSNAKSKPADQKAATEEKEDGDRDDREVWSLLRSDDPLDIQNSRGETAHVIALKNGHVECANLISYEKLKRAKELNKRLNALSHQRSGSPSILRLAKRSAKKYLQHYGSFDSLYFDHEDESDDDLMIASSHMRRSRTADPKACIEVGRKSTPPTTPANESASRRNQNKGLLARLNRRFQSNPDLFRVKATANTSQDEFAGGDTAGACDRQTGFSINEQAAAPISCEADVEKQGGRHRNMAKSISGGLKQQAAAPQSHQPVIKGASGLWHQRRSSGSTFGQGPQKRNLAEKLMNFLRIRPKYSVPSSASDMGLCASASSGARQHKRRLSKKYSQQYPTFSSIEQGNADSVDGENARYLRKGSSQPDLSPTEEQEAHSSTPNEAAPIGDLSETHDANHRWPVDVTMSAAPSLHSQYLADSSAQKYIDDWPYGNTVVEEATDASMTAITPFPTSWPPVPIANSGSSVLNK